jgi:hypothetical protein
MEKNKIRHCLSLQTGNFITSFNIQTTTLYGLLQHATNISFFYILYKPVFILYI